MSKPRYWTMPMLRITGCSDSMLWYRDLVGQLVPFEGDDGPYGFRSREPAGYVNYVRREDATVVKRVRVHSINRNRWPFNGVQARAVVEVPREQCGALCDELGACQSLQGCKQPAQFKSTQQTQHAKPFGQTRMFSIVESVVSIGVGFVVSLGITAVVMPAFGHDVTFDQNLAITGIFTVASLLRTYVLRRFFNRIYLRRFA